MTAKHASLPDDVVEPIMLDGQPLAPLRAAQFRRFNDEADELLARSQVLVEYIAEAALYIRNARAEITANGLRVDSLLATMESIEQMERAARKQKEITT